MSLKDVIAQRRAQAAQVPGAGGAAPPPTAAAQPTPAAPAPSPIIGSISPGTGSGASFHPTLMPHIGAFPGTGGQQGHPGDIAGTYAGRQMSPMETRIQNSIGGMLQNPTGYNPEQITQMHNRASEPMAAQQQQNAESIREDAVRRGAATSDADIRDQLNRSNMEGAKAQSDASFDVDKALADLARTGTLGAVGAGNQLTGLQLNDVNNKADLEMMMKQLQMQNGPLSGLGMAIQAGH